MKKNDKESTSKELKEKQQQDSSSIFDGSENIQPYELYDKNRIDTTNL